MDKQNVRAVLSAYRANETFADDGRFEAARQQTETDPALAQWWKDEQDLDRLIAAKLAGVAAPAGLKSQLLNPERRSFPSRAMWPRKMAMLAASIVLLAVFFGSWSGLFQPATSLAEYRDEMVSFIRLDPPLDMKSSQLSQVTAFLKEHGAPSGLHVPGQLQQLGPVGCRTLRFRGGDVALICFRRGDGDLMHMFVIDRKAMAKVKSMEEPQFAVEGDWMTAAWTDDEHTYLLAAKGSRESLAKLLETS
jgi:hypothetical protein